VGFIADDEDAGSEEVLRKACLAGSMREGSIADDGSIAESIVGDADAVS
jgi:hypothetical protein